MTSSEADRLNALEKYIILDTTPERAFEDINRLAAQICGTPIALIGLIDSTRQWFKAKVGLEVLEIPRNIAFCAHTIQQTELFVIQDTLADDRFATNPLVISEPNIRFYAGVSLITPEGYALGTLCVMDRVPRELSLEQKETLQILGRQVVAQLELQRNLAERKRVEEELQKVNNRLEIRVEERTSELRNTNAQLQSEIVERQRLETQLRRREQELSDFFENGAIGLHWVGADGIVLWANQAELDLLGYSREEYIGHHIASFHADQEVIDDILQRLTTKETLRDYEARLLCKDGSIRYVLIDSNVFWEDDQFIHTRCFTRDITDRKRVEEILRTRDRQQTVVAELSQRTLADIDLSMLMNEAVTLVAQSLEVEYSEIWELLLEGNALLLKAGIGWQEGLVGHSTVSIETNSLAGDTLLSRAPVIVEDLGTETRLSGLPLLHNHGVVSGVSVVIHNKNRPFGVLGAYTTRRRKFTEDDVNFLQAVANILATAIERKQEQELLLERSRLTALEADVGIALTRSNTLQDILQQCAQALVKHLNAAFARIWTLNAEENVLELQASAGMYTHINGSYSRVPVGQFKIGLIAQERQPHLTNNIIGDPRIQDQKWAAREGMVAFAGYPLIVEERVVGVMAIFARQPLPEDTLKAMAYVANGIALSIQRKREEEALRESEERYRCLVDLSPEMILVHREGKVNYVNPAGVTLYGASSPEEIEGKLVWDFVHPDYRETVKKLVQQSEEEEKPTGLLETKIVRLDGQVIYIESIGAPITYQGKKARQIFIRDITERKQAVEALQKAHVALEIKVTERTAELRNVNEQLRIEIAERQRAEEGLRQGEERFRSLSACSPVGIFIADVKRQCTYTNPRWQSICNFTFEEALGEGYLQSIHPGDREWVLADWSACVAKGQEHSIEYRLQTKEGIVRWVHARSAPIFSDTGELINYVGTIEDITERKQAGEALQKAHAELEIRVEQRTNELSNANAQLQLEIVERQRVEALLRKSEAHLRAIIETEPDCIKLIAPDGTLLEINAAGLAMIDANTADEVIGRSVYSLISPIYREALRTLNESVCQGNRAVFEYEILGLKGTRRWVETYAVPLQYGADANFVHLGVTRDITERKQTEEALRQSEERFRSLSACSPVGIFLTDTKGRCTYINPRYQAIAGCTFEEALGEGWAGSVHPDDREWVFKGWSAYAQGGREYSNEFRLQTPEGIVRLIHVRSSPMFSDEGELIGHVGTVEDITERKQVEQALRESEERLQAILDNSSTVIYLKDTQGRYILINRQYETLIHVIKNQVVGKTDYDIFPKEMADMYRANDQKVLESKSALEFEEIAPIDGEIRTYLEIKFPLCNSTGIPYAVCGIGTDITERKRAEELLQKVHDELELRVQERTGELTKANQELQTEITERKRAEEALKRREQEFKALVEHAPDIISRFNKEFRHVYVNPAVEEATGISPQSFIGKTDAELEMPADLCQLWEQKLRQVFETKQGNVFEFSFSISDETKYYQARLVPEFGNDGSVDFVLGIARNITALKQAEEQLIYDAFHDILTGLPNRALFMDRLECALEHTKRRADYSFAVLFLDLDRFKLVNDSLGHVTGDQLLIAIARRLEICLRSGDTVARLGGDEFTILLDDIKGMSDVINVADRIHKDLALPFNLNGYEVFTTASIGIALSASEYEFPEELLRDADIAMYQAKALGKARYEVFGKDMHTFAIARLQLEMDLRRAIERQEFRLHYQPIVLLETGTINGFEALVRWQHPDRGLLFPTEFISVAEETGLIIPIGHWVLREACHQMNKWQEQSSTTPPLTINVNLSGKQLAQPDLIEQIEKILQETDLNASSLKLEITESVIIENAEVATSILLQLRALGIHLQMDDFGTGYSSLSYLHHFPIDTLKIDRSFISRMSIDAGNLTIVQTILMLAHSLGMKVTAEGVETEAQLAQLRALKCEYVQGYFFSKPVNSEMAKALIAEAPQW